jgi:hypothetical protein
VSSQLQAALIEARLSVTAASQEMQIGGVTLSGMWSLSRQSLEAPRAHGKVDPAGSALFGPFLCGQQTEPWSPEHASMPASAPSPQRKGHYVLIVDVDTPEEDLYVLTRSLNELKPGRHILSFTLAVAGLERHEPLVRDLPQLLSLRLPACQAALTRLRAVMAEISLSACKPPNWLPLIDPTVIKTDSKAVTHHAAWLTHIIAPLRLLSQPHAPRPSGACPCTCIEPALCQCASMRPPADVRPEAFTLPREQRCRLATERDEVEKIYEDRLREVTRKVAAAVEKLEAEIQRLNRRLGFLVLHLEALRRTACAPEADARFVHDDAMRSYRQAQRQLSSELERVEGIRNSVSGAAEQFKRDLLAWRARCKQP